MELIVENEDIANSAIEAIEPPDIALPPDFMDGMSDAILDPVPELDESLIPYFTDPQAQSSAHLNPSSDWTRSGRKHPSTYSRNSRHSKTTTPVHSISIHRFSLGAPILDQSHHLTIRAYSWRQHRQFQHRNQLGRAPQRTRPLMET